tara:strand:+ start:37 stop:255 length:219 start_codon:yes stop_codon:yes gene_type:complete
LNHGNYVQETIRFSMPVEITSQLAYAAGEAISENIGEKLEKIPFWKKIRTYLVLTPLLVCTIYFMAITFEWI